MSMPPCRYLRQNLDDFDLNRRIKFGATVTLVTPVPTADGDSSSFGANKWEVHYSLEDELTQEVTQHVEVFEGVLVCTGRHGGGGFMPEFPNQDKFKGPIMHSSKYKFPEKHGLLGKRVAVVGIGNSGADIVTELGMINGGGMRNGGGEIVNEDLRSDTLLVARVGAHVVTVVVLV